MKILLALIYILFGIQIYAQNYDAEYLKNETKVIYNGKDIIQTVTREIRILNNRGTKYANIQIAYQEGNPIHNMEAAIFDNAGLEIRQLKKKEITSRRVWSGVEFYTDRRVLNFKLINNTFPYIIKYSYTKKIKDFISIANWELSTFKDINTQHASLVVTIPKNTKVNIYSRKIDNPIVNINDQTIQYTWSVHNYKFKEEEGLSPLEDETCPCIIMVPETFHYTINGKSSSWEAFGNWNDELIKDLDQLTPSERTKVHQLTDSILYKKDKIKILYHYMQDNTRYILVSEDDGGLVPYPASYVCQNKYGDCKALTNYMKALLKEAGIPSFYSTLFAGEKPVRINTEFPSQQFNHVILQVPLKEDTIWLECTDKNAPFNYLGPFTQNRYALVVKKDSTKLIKTPSSTINNALESFHVSIDMRNLNKETTFTAEANVKGKAFDKLSYFNSQLSEKEKQQYVNYFGIIKKADIQDFKIDRPDRDSCFFHLLLNGKINNLTQSLGSKILIKPFKAIYFNLEKPDKRKNDIFISYPINQCDTTEYIFNNNISSVKGLSKIDIENKFGEYHKDFEIKGNRLIIHKSFTLIQNSYPKDEYQELYSFLDQVIKTENQLTILSF